MRKFLGRQLPDSSTSPSDPSSLAASTIPATYRPSKSQDAAYAAGVPISCLDVSPDRRSVALGGPHILKTVVLDDPTGTEFKFSEGVDVRARIAAGGVAGPKANSAADQLNIRDVKWHGNNMVFTACANGRIFAYDVARLGAGGSEGHDTVHVQDDSRQVNTLDVNPHLKSWLLSGGQDGMVRCFDTANPIHTRQGFITYRQRFTGLRCVDPIRQVKWSPQTGYEMAACTDSGVVLKWDVRQHSKPLLRINAHEKACTGIAWHPDGQHLISAGSDCKIHVWEMGREAGRRQKPKWTITTPAPVAAVAWRPGVWSATAQGRRAAQVAVSYDDNSVRRFGTSAVHLYDLARPTMPYKEVERFESSPSALSWQDQDMLWTVGHDGMFNQCDMAYAPRAVDRQSTSAMDFSPRGDVLMFLDERARPPRPRASVLMQSDKPRRYSQSYPTSPQNQGLSVSRSDSEEDIVGTFLAPRWRIHKRRPSGRAAMSTTPPTFSSIDDGKQVLGLEHALKATGPFKLQQAMAFGHIPATKTVPVYQYLSSVYLETLAKELPCTDGKKTLPDRVTAIMEQYARAAEKTSLFRLAQTWRILSFAMGLLLNRRAQYHLEKRVSRHHQLKNGRSGSRTRGDNTPRRPSLQDRFLGRSLLSDIDSTSNVPTPIARPADRGIDHHDHAYHNGRKMLTPIEEPESFSIGPNIHDHMPEPRKRLESTPVPFTSEDSEGTHKSSTEGYDFYDMETLVHAIDMPTGEVHHPRRRVSRHDSNESYGQIFSISEGNRAQNALSPVKGSPRRPGLQSEASRVSEASEYHSRIRGEELQSSPRRRMPTSDSPEDVFMISQTTQPSEESYPSQQSSYPSAGSDDHEDHTPEPNFPPLPPQALTPKPIRSEVPSPTRPHPYADPNPLIIETDYLPWPEDPPYPMPLISSPTTDAIPALDPYTLLTRALEFECRTSALSASAIILLLKPLVPPSVIDTHQATAILRQHLSRLHTMGLFVEATLLRNVCVKGWPDGLPSWGENYTSIFGPAQRDVKVSLSCSNCHKPMELDPQDAEASIWTCGRCKAHMAPCAVCGHRDPEPASFNPIEDEAEGDDTLGGWWYCPGCAHGGHASCLQTWHSPDPSPSSPSELTTKFSSGCCPSDGCGHACLPGKYRSETTTNREELTRAVSAANSGVSSPRHSGVRDAGDSVPQSRAVGMAREALGKSAGARDGILSSSPGGRERRKSVKFAKTG